MAETVLRNGAAAFSTPNRKNNNSAIDDKVASLERKLVLRNEVLSELMEEHIKLKRETRGGLTGCGVPPDRRDSIIDFIHHWHRRTEFTLMQLVLWVDISYSNYSDWRLRYGKANEHNALVPRDHWLEQWEKQAIIGFTLAHPLEGYRRCAFMMIDADMVAANPATFYRVIRTAA